MDKESTAWLSPSWHRHYGPRHGSIMALRCRPLTLEGLISRPKQALIGLSITDNQLFHSTEEHHGQSRHTSKTTHQD